MTVAQRSCSLLVDTNAERTLSVAGGRGARGIVRVGEHRRRSDAEAPQQMHSGHR
jgi:hypothetical protein